MIDPIADATFEYVDGDASVIGVEAGDLDLGGPATGQVPVLVLDTPVWAQLDLETVFRSRGKIRSDFVRQGGLGHPDLDPGAEFAGDLNNDGNVDHAFGHAEFIDSVIMRVAPMARVFHEPAATNFGASTDSIIAAQLAGFLDALSDDELPGIVSLSVGGYTQDDKAPIALSEVIDRFVQLGWVIVASAGNDTSCRPSWPAALDDVIGVGAIGPQGPAPFSNFGPWVNACAPGIDVLGEVPSPYLTIVECDDDLHGTLSNQGQGQASTSQRPPAVRANGCRLQVGSSQARPDPAPAAWSGTSFSAPIVAAAIARRAHSLAGGSSPGRSHLAQAAHDLVWDDRLFQLPGLGTVVNVG